MSKKPTYEELERRVKELEAQSETYNFNLSELQRLKYAIEGAPVAIGMSDPEGYHYYQNKAFTDLFGYRTAEELESLGGGKSLCLNTDVAEEKFNQIMAGKCWIGEHEMVTRDGRRLTVNERADAIKDLDGNIIALIGIISDITEIEIAKDELRERENFLNTLINSIPVPVFYKDRDGEYLGFNNAFERFFGKTKKELVGKSVFDINPPKLAETYHSKDEELMRSGEAQQYESQVKDAQGELHDVVFNKAVFTDSKGNVNGLIGTILDITEKKHMEKELIRARKMEAIGTLAGGIAHDFNNILSSILGFAELALDDAPKGSTLEDSLQEVYTAGKRARDLVKQILAFARQSDEERKPIRVDTIAEEVLKLIRSTIPSTIEIRERINSRSLILGNPSQIHQVFMNLCTNAAHAMEDGGGILTIGLADVELDASSSSPFSELKPGSYMKVSVSDTGPGISPSIIGSIFDPYFTTKKVGEGTGMGLALVHGIVESCGGKIAVDSELGKGTDFSVYLPITKKRDAHRPYVAEKLPSGTERVLFVDDELPIAKMGSQLLERLGYSVTVRTSSVEAAGLFRSKPHDFDLVIADMTMPNMTGDKLAIELMKIRPDIPVILCTGYSKKISAEIAAEIGIKAFIYKPVVKADLAKTVRKVLDAGRSEA